MVMLMAAKAASKLIFSSDRYRDESTYLADLSKLKDLKAKADAEELINQNQIKSKLIEQERVAYGNEIQLFHADSHSYLTAKKSGANYDKSCNKVELTEKGQ